MNTISVVVRNECDNTWPKFFYLSSMPLYSLFITSLFITSIVPSFVSSSTNALPLLQLLLRFFRHRHSLSFRYCYYGLSSCYEFVFYFSFWFCFSHPKPPIFFFFFSCFCFSHPKHRNPTKLDRNRMQSVGSMFFPHMLVLMVNI